MYCKVCGQDGPGDGISCTYCGSPFSSKEIIYQPEAEHTDEDSDVYIVSQRSSVSSKTLLLPIILFVLTVICIVLFCISGPSFSIGTIFRSPSSRMEKVYCDLIEKTFEKVYLDDNDSPTDALAVQYGTDITLSPAFMSFFADALEVDPDDISGLSNIQIDCDATYKDDFLTANYDLSFNKEEIISIEQYVDGGENRQYLRIPQLSDQLLRVDASQDVALSDVIGIESNTVAHIDSSVLKEVSIYYTKMLIAGFDNINQYSQTVTVGELSQKQTVLQASISNKQLCHTMIAILEDASVNPSVYEIIRSIEEHTGKAYYEEFLKSLENEILELRKLSQQSNAYDSYTLYTYLNRRKEISGIKFEYINNGNVYCVFSANTVMKGLQFATNMSALDRYCLQGKGTAGKAINGSYSVFDSDNLICGFLLTDLTYSGSDISGAVRIVPAEQIVENIADSMGLYKAYLNSGRFPDFCVEFTLNWKSDVQNTKITCNDRYGQLILASFSAERKTGIPQENHSLPLQQALALDSWRSTLNQDAVDALLGKIAHSEIVGKIFESTDEIQ